MTALRIPPNNLEAEESLLGAMLLSHDAISSAVMVCTIEDFYKPAHAHIFGAIVALWERGEPSDAVTVLDELTRSRVLDSVGDPSILVSLQSNTPSVANATHYAQIVKEYALLRRLIEVAGEIADLGYSIPEDIGAAIDYAEQRVFAVSRDQDKSQSVLSWKEWMVSAVDELVSMEPGFRGLRTGFVDLDRMMGGLQPSNLVIIGGRPSMGKTSLALGMLTNIARAGESVLMCSLEMSAWELMLRVLSAESGVDASHLRTRSLKDQDTHLRRAVDSTLSRLGDLPFYICDDPDVSVIDIRAQARRLQAKHGLSCVLVDYLQLMSAGPGRRADNRVVEVSQISRGLKILARELNVPVIALSQLSRGVESRDNKRPVLADLRESGSIEQDADVVVFIYREDAYHPGDVPSGEAELIVAKHRNGPTGSVKLQFVAREASFNNLAHREDTSGAF